LPILFNTYPQEEMIVQQYIRADFEYKVITVGYKSIPVILKIAYDRERSRPDYTKCQVISLAFHDELVQLAERAAQALGRELAKTDIVEANGKYYVLEVNRWPGLEVFEKYSGHNVAKDFVAYIKSKVS
jgi:glutathione synthase/RimK-type ligase-like ATP-grasp enzyme